ncbi:hypothetical protein P4284_08905 [Bacillus swezeyi]|nr:hypothetical protein [Bacillus swezeyi]MED2976818.1 hypothetical protein [Bacillus swezeyi]
MADTKQHQKVLAGIADCLLCFNSIGKHLKYSKPDQDLVPF